MQSWLDLLHSSRESRGYIKHSRSVVLGGGAHIWVLSLVRYDLDKLADYCPDLDEISCYSIRARLEKFRTLYSTTLERLGILITILHSTIQKTEKAESVVDNHLHRSCYIAFKHLSPLDHFFIPP